MASNSGVSLTQCPVEKWLKGYNKYDILRYEGAISLEMERMT